jgi:hypothetical protein
MRRALLGLVVLFLAATAAPARADERIGIGLKAGTYGFGLDLTFRVLDWLALRGSYQGLDFTASDEHDGVDYDGDFEVGGEGLLVDFYPAKNRFRLTAGYFRNRNEAALDAVPSEPEQIGDTVYDPAEIGTLSGTLAFDDGGPYLGIGWGNAARRPGVVGFVFDFGVLRQGSGAVELQSSTGLVSPADLELEASEIEDDIAGHDLWPVISFGISFRLF